MGKISLSSALGLLPVVGPAIANLPQFVDLFKQVMATFDDEADQKTLKDALKAAQDTSAQAHNDLQDLVRLHGG